MRGFYFAYLCCLNDEEPEDRFHIWAKRLMWLSRYGRIPPSESKRYPLSYLCAFEKALGELIEEEKPDPMSDH